jgi:hypothetical protein
MGDDLLDRSDALDERIANSSDVDALVKASRRNWLLIRILAVSVALDLALSAGVGYLAVQARQTAAQANSIQAQARTACAAANQARAGQIQLWHYVLDMTAATSRTPEQQQQAARFRAYIDELFAPRRC